MAKRRSSKALKNKKTGSAEKLYGEEDNGMASAYLNRAWRMAWAICKGGAAKSKHVMVKRQRREEGEEYNENNKQKA